MFFPHCSFDTQRSPALQKNSASGSKKCFSTLLLWNSEKLGFAKKQTLKIVFCALTLWNSDKPGFAKNNLSGSIFFGTALIKLRQARLSKKHFFMLYKILFSALFSWNSDKPGFPKNNFSGSTKLFFRHCSHETQTSPAFQKTFFHALQNYFFGTVLMKLRQARLSKKQFFRLYKIIFSALFSWNSDKPSFPKNNFSGSKKSFFRKPLVKSANSTSLPRLSSLQIAQVHAIHNSECP